MLAKLRVDLIGIALAVTLGGATPAWAQDKPDPAPAEPKPDRPGLLDPRPAPEGVVVQVGGVFELRHDPWIASRFNQGGLGAHFGFVVPVRGLLGAQLSASYQRAKATGAEASFQQVPIAVLALARFGATDDLEVYGGLGPALIVWSESGQDEAYMRELLQLGPADPAPTVLRGSRPALEMTAGARFDLGLTQPSLPPIPESAVRGVLLDLNLTRRIAPSRTGFNFNAWRVGVALALRF